MNVVLPDFDKFPSVMSHAEVSAFWTDVMDAVELGSSHSINEIADVLCDGISALAYEPDQQFDDIVSQRVFVWVHRHWSDGDEEFIDAATALLANLCIAGVADFLIKAAQDDPRPFVRMAASEVLRELGKTI